MVLISTQEKTGGPRAGNGAAVRAAMWARAIGRRACASGCSAGRRKPAGGGGAAPPRWTHRGQSSVWPRCSCAPSSLSTMSLTSPAAEQISSMACGWTKGDAVATPIATANHASMKQASERKWRRADMGVDCRGLPCRFGTPARSRTGRVRRSAPVPASPAGRWRAAYAAAPPWPADRAAPTPA